MNKHFYLYKHTFAVSREASIISEPWGKSPKNENPDQEHDTKQTPKHDLGTRNGCMGHKQPGGKLDIDKYEENGSYGISC